MRIPKTVIVMLILSAFCPLARGQSASNSYELAKRAARSKEINFAFMHFRALLNDFPESPYREEALFAVGEHYFTALDYPSAQTYLTMFIDEYSQAQGRLVALAQLYRIAQSQADEGAMTELKRQMSALRQTFPAFKKYHVMKFRSPLNRDYKVIVYNDRMKFYIERQIFLETDF